MSINYAVTKKVDKSKGIIHFPFASYYIGI